MRIEGKMTSENPMERRLRIAGIFVLLGLVIEAISLRWNHPAAFLVLAFVGIPIASLGVAVYLYSLVSPVKSRPNLENE